MNGLINKKKYREQKGMSILEALVASVIVGIGFIAIFQMVSYSVQSVDVSNERTKSSYLSGMVAEGDDGQVIKGGIIDEAHLVLKNMGKILAHFNLTYSDVFKCLGLNKIYDIGMSGALHGSQHYHEKSFLTS